MPGIALRKDRIESCMPCRSLHRPFRELCNSLSFENPGGQRARTVLAHSEALWRGLDREHSVHRDGDDCKGSSRIIAHGRKVLRVLPGAQHRIHVVGSKNHHMRMPVTSRSEDLIRGPHIGKTHSMPLGDLAVHVRRLNRFLYLFGGLAFQPEFVSEFVIRQDRASRLRIEADGRPGLWVVGNIRADWKRSVGGSPGEPAHYDAHKAVITLVHDTIARRGKHLNGCMDGDASWSRAFRKRYLGILRHHVL